MSAMLYKVDNTVPISSFFYTLHSLSVILFRDRNDTASRIIRIYDFEKMRQASIRFYALRSGGENNISKLRVMFFIFRMRRSVVSYNWRYKYPHSSRARYDNFISRLCTTWRIVWERKNDQNLRFAWDEEDTGTQRTNTVSFVWRKKRWQDFFAFSIAQSDGSAVSYRHCSVKPADTMAGCVPFY